MSKVTIVAMLVAQASMARADIYLCTDAKGRRQLADAIDESKGNCKLLEVPKLEAAPKAEVIPMAASGKKDAPKKEGVSIGMTMTQVRKSSWGEPDRVHRTINAGGVSEQWVYRGGFLYFTDGVLTTIQN